MSVNIQVKQDFSYLFSSLGSGAAGVSGSNFLSDYASIKNGSYAKLMKAYYGGNTNDSVNAIAKKQSSSSKLTEAESKEYAQVQTASDALKDSADALLATGSKSLFKQIDITTKDEDGNETTEKGYDVESIYNAVNNFVKNYNSVINAAGETDSSTVLRRTANMLNSTTAHLKSLLAIGISVNADSTLSIDKDAFMKADMNKVKSLFNGNGSYAYNVSAQASLINYAADRELSRGTSYTFNGSYSANFSNGNLFSSYF